MSDPITLAMAVQFAAFVAVFLCVGIGHRMGPVSVLAIAAACMPVALFQYKGLWVFVGDLYGILLAAGLLVNWAPRMRGASARNWVIGAYCFGVVAWTILSARLAQSWLGETIELGKLIEFIPRSACNVAFFTWAYRTGFSNRRALVLLTIPPLFWLVFAGAGLAQFVGLLNVDAFWRQNWQFVYRGAMTSGFMGMDKPQLALWAAYTSVIAIWLNTGRRRALGRMASITLPISALIVLLIGSRQGILALCVVMVTSAIIQIARRRPARQFAPVLAGLVILGLVGPVLWSAVDPVRRARATASFEELLQVSSADDLANKRDSSTLTLLQYILDNPHRLILGSGVGTEKSGYIYTPDFTRWPAGFRTYAEGEFVRLLWAGGLVSLISYLVVLGVMCATAIKGLGRRNGPVTADAAGLLFTLTVTGSFFALGQYHLFTALYHNVPCCYLLWVVSGILMGHLARCTVGRECPATDASVLRMSVRRTILAHADSTASQTDMAEELDWK